MIKKYEIINDGGKKRIKALRSFHVQGRYVNIGDVGGIVYDENTLSQEGNGWIFSGNLNYPSIRVSGDSIVDTNGYEADVTGPRPFVSITGTSALIGAHDFVTGETGAKTLAVSDVEQGTVTANIGSTYGESKVSDARVVRLKTTLYCYTAGVISVACDAGYKVSVLCYNIEGKLSYKSDFSTGVNVTDKNPAYIAVLVKKTDEGIITPADIVAANVRTSKLSIEAYLDINDSRLEFQYTSAMTVRTHSQCRTPRKTKSMSAIAIHSHSRKQYYRHRPLVQHLLTCHSPLSDAMCRTDGFTTTRLTATCTRISTLRRLLLICPNRWRTRI